VGGGGWFRQFNFGTFSKQRVGFITKATHHTLAIEKLVYFFWTMFFFFQELASRKGLQRKTF